MAVNRTAAAAGLAPGAGLEVLILAAPVVEVLGATQLTLEGGTVCHDEDLATLVDRLSVRFGAAAVSRPLAHASWWPEHAVVWAPALEEGSGPAWPADRPRPLRLLARPDPIDVMAPVPDDPPVMFRWRGVVHRVNRAEGPERLEPEWWRGLEGLRDYYRVEDIDGRRFWLFRAGLYHPDRPPSWFLHGLFG